MNVTGIIAEYNPFHNGHAYLIGQARQQNNADYIVVVMSGDYVQRGAPALLEKHVRAEMALRSGADLVLELPVSCASASARDFARGAVRILENLGVVNSLCFGSESGDLRPFVRIAGILTSEPDIYRTILISEQKKGATYPAAHHRALLGTAAEFNLFGDLGEFKAENFLNGPNNTLGVEYIRALQECKSSIKPLTIRRTSDDYNSETAVPGSRFASATALRRMLRDQETDRIPELVPADALSLLKKAQDENRLLTEDDFSLLLRCRLMRSTPEILTGFLDFPHALANRACRLLGEYISFSQFAELLKTKDITRVRVNRALLHAVLEIPRTPEPRRMIRILGFRRKASPLLKSIKAHAALPVVTKLADAPLELYREDLWASNLYHAVSASKAGRPSPDERSIPPVILDI